MRKELYLYDVYPKIFPVGKKSRVHLHPLSPQTAFSETQYDVQVCPVSEENYAFGPPAVTAVDVQDGELVFDYEFMTEQEYLIRVFKKGETKTGIPTTMNPPDIKDIVTMPVYALNDDLFERRPLVGDFHLHTTGSDGKDSSLLVAAFKRESGCDFTSIADHFNYKSSVETIEFFKDVEMDFCIYRGEEIHSPGNRCHIVNFAADESVSTMCYEQGNVWLFRTPEKMGIKQSWVDEVKALEATLTNLPQGVAPFTLASCILVFQKIRDAGGMAIFAHPHWRDGDLTVHNVPDALTRYIIKMGYADAIEVENGVMFLPEQDMYTTQPALLYELAAEGFAPPIVGGSDSHSLFNDNAYKEVKTIVFAKDNTREAIIEAVKNRYCAVVEQFTGEHVHMYLSYRMVSFGMFLHKWLFPLTAPLYEQEGRLLRAYVAGDRAAAVKLKALKGQTTEMRERYYAK